MISDRHNQRGFWTGAGPPPNPRVKPAAFDSWLLIAVIAAAAYAQIVRPIKQAEGVVAESTLITLALLAAVYSQGASQSNPCATIGPTADISEIGTFSNLRFTEEHQYGETVLLWRAGPCIFGLLESAQGLQGDTPIGELQDVTYSPNTGALKFSAKLTVGVITGPASPRPQPSRDLFTFDGTFGSARLTGALIHATQLDPRPPARNIVLTTSTRDTEFMRGSATYGAWRQQWEQILKRRGPKW
jgi:hypothetical protein